MVGVVIVNYNTSKLTLEAARSALMFNPDRILIVDNGSCEREKQILITHADNSNFEVIYSERNLGFSGGNNFGVRYLLKRFNVKTIVLLNSDAKIINPQVINIAIEEASKPNVGIVSVEVLNPGNVKQKVLFEYPRTPFSRILKMRRRSNALISGVFWVLSSNVIHDVGLLDESFFMYGEDFEYSVRTERAGFKNKVLQEVGVFHLRGGSNFNSNQRAWQQRLGRSRLWTMNKPSWDEQVTIVIYGLLYMWIHSNGKRYLPERKIFFKL